MPKNNGKTKVEVDISIDYDSCKHLNELSILTLKFMLGGLMRFKYINPQKENQFGISGRKLAVRLHIPLDEARFLLEDSMKAISEIKLYFKEKDNDTKLVSIIPAKLIEEYTIDSYIGKTRRKKNNREYFVANVTMPVIVKKKKKKVIGLLFLQLDRIRAEIKS